jgi:ATP-binding cassette subfamily F protein 3
MLSIAELTYRLGSRVLFDHADAVLPPRARVGFVGRNGSGKTTLFRLIGGEIAPEGGTIELARGLRLGRVEQEAPGGPQSLIDFVLAADHERHSLLVEAETASDPARIADIHMRLADIEAHAAPSRAAAILAGLGFDEAAQQRALSEFSGGWRMRVALAAVLFVQPDLLLLDEPTNYLDLEGTLWLIEHLSSYPASTIVISHDRDLLDAVADHILHLDQSKLTLWRGNYTSFETQRLEMQRVQAKAIKRQDETRKRMTAFVERFRAKATKARQAQSRLKMLEKMETISAVVDQDVLPIVLPSPARNLSPPIISLDAVATGYDERTVLSRLDLRLSNDDRIGLLGANGNGKSTFAKLLAGRLEASAGRVVRAPKLSVGFFAQHQVDDLDAEDTPFRAVARLMRDAPESRIRGKAAQFGFSGPRADTPVAQLSGGEKARLLLGLSTFAAPHLVILDEPTNHLDIDSRTALIEAINAYEGAVILVSHDKHLLESCADRLWLVANGTVKEFDGDLAEYTALVLGRESRAQRKPAPPPSPPPAKPANDKGAASRLKAVEARVEKLQALLRRVDETLGDPDLFRREPEKAGDLARQRRELAAALEKSEDEWLALSAETESA